MPNVKKRKEDKSTYQRTVSLRPETGKQVEKMAEAEQRPLTAMLRILIERGIEASK